MNTSRTRCLWLSTLLTLAGACQQDSTHLTTTAADGGSPSADASMAAADGGKPHLGPGQGYDFSNVTDECGLHTGYTGDVLCLKPPKPSDGFQLHLGPKSYDDPAEVKKFLLQPGQEVTQCLFVRTPNDTLITYYERDLRMRPNSHHMFLFQIADNYAPPADQIDSGNWTACGDFSRGRVGALGGAEVPIVHYPEGGKYAPENVGIGRSLAPHSLIRIEMHAFNNTDKPILREAWANVYFKPRSEITNYITDVNILGGLNVSTQPHTNEIMHVEFTLTGAPRILNLFGHGHSHMARFAAYRRRGSERTLLLEDWDWQHPTVMRYETTTKNPVPDPKLQTAGGYSGVLLFKQGDVLEWECEVHNTSDQTLTYKNSVAGGEMCNIFGELVGNGGGLGAQALTGHVTKLP